MFAIIGEELGFAGTVSVLLLFVLFLLIGVSITARASSPYMAVLAAGYTMLISIQALLKSSDILRRERKIYEPFESPFRGHDPTVTHYKLTGGAVVSAFEQADRGGFLERMPENLQELARVQEELGNWWSVTPGSQILWTTAVNYVLYGRYERPSLDLQNLILERYGPLPFREPEDWICEKVLEYQRQVHVSIEPAESEKVRKKWEKWGEGVRMVVLNSPYRLLLEPLLEYVNDLAQQRQSGETMTIVVPEFVSRNRITTQLHMNTADLLRSQLKRYPAIVIIDVPYQVHEKGDKE